LFRPKNPIEKTLFTFWSYLKQIIKCIKFYALKVVKYSKKEFICTKYFVNLNNSATIKLFCGLFFSKKEIISTKKRLEVGTMLSRRNIRVKVMQSLYAINRDKSYDGDLDLSTQVYRESIRQSYDLYLFNILQLREVTKRALKDEAHRKGKHLPSDFDKQFSAKLYTNSLIQSTFKDNGFIAALAKSKVEQFLTDDNTRLLYNDFAKTPEYKAYLKNPNTTDADQLEILLFLFKHAVTGEIYNDLMDNYFSNWWDDKSLVVGAVKKTLKSLPLKEGYIAGLQPGEDTVTEFGEALLQDVLRHNDKLLTLIEPTLNNWDAERVAVIDMVLLKMALSELLNFPTIPTKVTLNEFVEIAKLYSTDKSKDFINGILDRLLKKLNQDGLIKKEGRGLK